MSWTDWVLLAAVVVMSFIGLRYRRQIARCALACVANVFGAALIAGLVGWAFDLLGDSRLIFVGLLVAIVAGMFVWLRLLQILDEQFK